MPKPQRKVLWKNSASGYQDPTDNKRELGSQAENIVLKQLVYQGKKIIARNVHISNLAEIDIIASEPLSVATIQKSWPHKNVLREPNAINVYNCQARSKSTTILFVEVRSTSTPHLHPSQILSKSKIKNLHFAARSWLKKWGLPEYTTNWRIDLAVVLCYANNRIKWYKGV